MARAATPSAASRTDDKPAGRGQASALKPPPFHPVQLAIVGKGEKLLNQFCGAGLERVISKLATGKYVGSRSGGWLKTKCIKRQEFVIAGWTPSDKSRSFRSLILGVHEKGELRYTGKAAPVSTPPSCFA